MMDANEFLDLDALHDAIEAAIRTQFPDLQTVEFYRTDERKDLTLPAVLLDLCEFEGEPDMDPGTEQLAVSARFEAEIIFGYRTPNVKREIRKFSAAFAAWLRLRRWPGISTDAAQVVGCYPDNFDPELDNYEVWRVEWSQVLYLGNNTWTNDGTIPTQVLVGYSPKIGAGNETEYTQIETDPTVVTP